MEDLSTSLKKFLRGLTLEELKQGIPQEWQDFIDTWVVKDDKIIIPFGNDFLFDMPIEFFSKWEPGFRADHGDVVADRMMEDFKTKVQFRSFAFRTNPAFFRMWLARVYENVGDTRTRFELNAIEEKYC